MENYSDVLRRVLNQITLELTTAEMDLNKINLSKDFMQYMTDILRLADSDVNLLANYYMESTGEKKDSFSWLLEKSIPDKNFRLQVKEQLKNMYYLNKNKLNKTSQYFEAKKCVVDFILILKDFKLDDDDEREEKRILKRISDLKKMQRYFSTDSSKIYIKNIDRFKDLVMSLNITDADKTKVFELILLNEIKFFNKNLKETRIKQKSHKLKVKKSVYNNLINNLSSFDFINNCLIKAGLKGLVKIDLLEDTNATREREYRSIIDMLKNNPDMNPETAFRDFYKKWDNEE